jgi:hypothetical protein
MRKIDYGRTIWFGLSGSLLLAGLAAPPVKKPSTGTKKPAVAAKKPVSEYGTRIKPVLDKFCAPCHTGQNPAGGVSFASLATEASARKSQALLLKIGKNVHSGAMPPPGLPKPSAVEKTRLMDWIDAVTGGDCRLADPGRVTMRRLNREEYNNTIRDLVGVDFRPADDFPSDDVGYGFDNIGDVLSVSPLLTEKYLSAAEQIARKAIVVKGSQTEKVSGPSLSQSGSVGDMGSVKFMFSNATVSYRFDVPVSGKYVFRVRAYETPAGNEHSLMAIKVGDAVQQVHTVKAPRSKPEAYETTLQLEAGERQLQASFTNDFYDPNAADENRRDRNLGVIGFELEGPIGAPTRYPASHLKVLGPNLDVSDRAKATRTVLQRFVTRAYRRPARPEEIDRLLQLAKTGETFEHGIRLAMMATLSSPHFLFRIEAEPGVAKGPGVKKRPLGGYEVANRLSYFLWSSMPDDALMAAAASGELSKPAGVQAQVRRMLKDSRSKALASNFAGQWLQLRKLSQFEPDKTLFPAYEPALRDAMVAETTLFFENVVREDRSVLEFLDARYTFLNERLAKHYGIPDVTGDQFRKVSLEGTPRAGVLSHASVLTVTSNPTRTSPVKRGKWVLENLFNAPPPPAPPGVGDLPDDGKTITGKTLRQRMEEHRKNPACAQCHSRMDPIGFGLENFDAIGRWRTQDGGDMIDASGQLPDGGAFKGPAELRTVLKSKKDLYLAAISEKLLTYALGRGIGAEDKCHVDEIAKKLSASGYRFSVLAESVALSEPFRYQKPK